MKVLLYLISGGSMGFTALCFILAKSVFHEMLGALFFIASIICLIGAMLIDNNQQQYRRKEIGRAHV